MVSSIIQNEITISACKMKVLFEKQIQKHPIWFQIHYKNETKPGFLGYAMHDKMQED